MVRYSSLLNCRPLTGAEGSIPSPSAMKFSKKYTLVLVDAKWNNHKELAANFAQIAKDCTDEDFDFQELDVDEDQELAYALGIKNVPVICYFFEGRLDKTVIGNNQDIKQQMEWMIEDCDKVGIYNMNTFPNPLSVNLGEGRIEITVYSSGDSHGLLLRDSGEKHEIGEATGSVTEENHKPIAGEVYINCSNRESALVLMEQVCRLVAKFN